MSKFKEGDKVRVDSGKYVGVEGIVQWEERTVPPPSMYFVKITKTAGTTYNLDFTDSFGEEYLELIEPDVREVGKKINPELVKVGDKIRAVRPAAQGIEESRAGYVHTIDPKDSKGFWTGYSAFIGFSNGDYYLILEEESTIHELTLAPVGTKFKAVRGPGSTCYLIYTKYREGWWVSESYDKATGKLVEINMRSEQKTINEFDKGRSEML